MTSQEHERSVIDRALSREKAALEEMSRTRVAPFLASMMIALFLFIIFSVPVIQQVHDALQWKRGLRATWPSSFLERIPAFGTTVLESCRQARGTLVQRIFTVNRSLLQAMNRYEEDIKESSWIAQLFLPRIQQGLFLLGVVNDNVYVGREGWFFYAPDVNYVIQFGFLDPRHVEGCLRARKEWQKPVQPDPIKAMVQFHQQLNARSIKLILMPTPVKPMIHPEKLTSHFQAGDSMLQNASYGRFIQQLAQNGLVVFDCAPLLANARSATGLPQYLATDSHWRPEAMERVADALALQINSLFPASVHSMERYRRLPVDLTSRGDIAAMLKTSHYQSWETVRITQIVTVDGQCWQADPMAEILVLGDSFCNIYSLPSLGWGSSAGLVEQLSFRLNRPVDRITRNDQGAAATRSALLAELKANPDRLRHTRCIVWQFVVRELAQGDWQLLSFPPPGRSDQNE